jgi:hypothetical protein
MMRIRDSWLMEGHYFEEPSDWAVSPELRSLAREEPPEDRGFRSLLEDPEACRHWGSSPR